MDNNTYALSFRRDDLRTAPKLRDEIILDVLGDVFDYFDRKADGDENGPNIEAGLAHRVNLLMLLVEGK